MNVTFIFEVSISYLPRDGLVFIFSFYGKLRRQQTTVCIAFFSLSTGARKKLSARKANKVS